GALVDLDLYCDFVRFCYFFFSSRRRHTRSKRDWSSDVCSSDLVVLAAQRVHADAAAADIAGRHREVGDCDYRGRALAVLGDAQRSEERRVGKEWRSRGGADQEHKEKRGVQGGIAV